MLSHWRSYANTISVVCLLHIALPSAKAIDPFTIAGVISAGASAVSAISGAAAEIGASADAFGELYAEIDSGAHVNKDGQKIIKEIREIESLGREAGFTAKEISDLLHSEKADLTKFAATLRHVTKAIRAGKRVVKLLARLQHKAQLSQVESAEVQKEQLTVQYRQLNEQIKGRLYEKKKFLQTQISRKKQMELHYNDIKKMGGRSFKGSGIYTFPKVSGVFRGAIELAKKMRPAFLALVFLVFFARVIYYQFGLQGPGKFGGLLRDVALCCFLLAVFPEMLHALQSAVSGLVDRISEGKTEQLKFGTILPDFKNTNLPKGTLFFLTNMFSWIKYVVFLGAEFLFNSGLSFLVLFLPLAIFSTYMLRFKSALPMVLGAILAFSLWPFFWNLLGVVGSQIWQYNETISDLLKTVLFILLQFLAPLIVLAVSKGYGPAEALGQVARSLGTTVTGVAAGMAGRSSGGLAGRLVGQSTRYGAKQLGSRVLSSYSRAKGHHNAQRNQLHTGTNVPIGTRSIVKQGISGFVLNAGYQVSNGDERTSSRLATARQFARGFKNKKG